MAERCDGKAPRIGLCNEQERGSTDKRRIVR